MRGRFKLFLVLLFAMAVCGCGKKELPPDTPWNNGYNAIMETENGYYCDSGYRHSLQFHEKGTDTEILLCDRPECQHNGEDSCVATYHNMRIVNSVLYDGSIYILSKENEKDFASTILYRASLDGSTIDKVGTVLSAGNPADKACKFKPQLVFYSFIIHKGYAYIPVYMAFSNTDKGFVGGGMMRMNIQTGAVEQIYAMERYFSPEAGNPRGCGDYVYFDVVSGKGAQDTGTFRYNIKDGTVEHILGEFGEKNHLFAAAVTEEKLYVLTRSPEDKLGVGAFDNKTGEFLGTLFDVDMDVEFFWQKNTTKCVKYSEEQDEVVCGSWGLMEKQFTWLTAYQDKLFFWGKDRAFVYSDKGELLGQIGYDFPVSEGALASWKRWPDEPPSYIKDAHISHIYPSGRMRIKICGDKLYAVCRSNYTNADIVGTGMTKGIRVFNFDVYSCPLEDVLNGIGKWNYEYTSFCDYADVQLYDDDWFGHEEREHDEWREYAYGESDVNWNLWWK